MCESEAADPGKGIGEAGALADGNAEPPVLNPPTPSANGSKMTADELQLVEFALDLIDHLAHRHDFDPAELISPRTGRSLAPALERLRNAVRQPPDSP